MQELGQDDVQIRVVVWVSAGERRRFERYLRLRLKEALENADIEMPNRQVDVWLRCGRNRERSGCVQEERGEGTPGVPPFPPDAQASVRAPLAGDGGRGATGGPHGLMQKMLGHSGPRISLDVYSWISDEDMPSSAAMALRREG